jgi:phosphoribosyl 1,2-cyclic phosphate phosphodiesterase
LAVITFLGTGTSQGVPVIGCKCAVCASHDVHDKRLRASVLYTSDQSQIVIDAGPDFRQQMLREGVDHLDAILITHEHNDHVIGIDDVRPFNFKTGQAMRIYAEERVANDIQKRFEYVFGAQIPGIPRIELCHLEAGATEVINGVCVEVIRVMHGALPIFAYRIGDFVYITDMKTISGDWFERLRGVKVLVVSALHHRPHPAHMDLDEALAFIERVREIASPDCQMYLTHMSHQMGLAKDIALLLPPYVRFAYDGLQIDLG